MPGKPKVSEKVKESVRSAIGRADAEDLERIIDEELGGSLDWGGEAPLIIEATVHGRLGVLLMLLKKGADPNTPWDGAVPLEYARFPSALILLRAGADPSIKVDGRFMDEAPREHRSKDCRELLRWWRGKKLGMRAPLSQRDFVVWAARRASVCMDPHRFLESSSGRAWGRAPAEEVADYIETNWDRVARVIAAPDIQLVAPGPTSTLALQVDMLKEYEATESPTGISHFLLGLEASLAQLVDTYKSRVALEEVARTPEPPAKNGRRKGPEGGL